MAVLINFIVPILEAIASLEVAIYLAASGTRSPVALESVLPNIPLSPAATNASLPRLSILVPAKPGIKLVAMKPAKSAAF